jgi:voltage-gated potassium channel
LNSKRPKRKRRLKRLLVCLAVLVVLVCLVALLYWAEQTLAPDVGFWSVLENTIIVLMGEYPDKPSSVLGRIAQLALLVFGTLMFGAVVGKMSSFFVTHALWKEKAMKSFKDHIVICNWNSKAPGIIRQLLDANQETPRDIVVVSTSQTDPKQEFAGKEGIYFIQDDPTHHAVLQKLNASSAKAIILLADKQSAEPDDKNALIALAIKHLEQSPGQEKDIHVVAELVNQERRRHLLEAGVDEVVSGRDYSSGIIAQSALFRNMSQVYQNLLTYSGDTNELYFIEPHHYPVSFLGLSFAELCQRVCQANANTAENPLLLLGVKRGNGKILLNPQKHSFTELLADDSLIVMAFHYVDQVR